jgi:hypothetical protein
MRVGVQWDFLDVASRLFGCWSVCDTCCNEYSLNFEDVRVVLAAPTDHYYNMHHSNVQYPRICTIRELPPTRYIDVNIMYKVLSVRGEITEVADTR